MSALEPAPEFPGVPKPKGTRNRLREAFKREWLTPSQSAEKYLKIVRDGLPPIPYDFNITPYSREPLDMAASRLYQQVVFVAPQQAGKTQPILGLMQHHAVAKPANFMLVEKDGDEARKFNKIRLEPSIKASPMWQAKMTGRKSDDNNFDKTYSNGVFHEIVWPSKNKIAGKPIGVCAITDYDRMSAILGHGNLFDLTHARSKTFGSGRMTFCESSPGFHVRPGGKVDKDGFPQELDKHEFPNCAGIGALYNRGTRKRWYWQCMDDKGCGHWFIPEFKWLDDEFKQGMDPQDVAESAYIKCPACLHRYYPQHKRALNLNGHWIGPNQTLDLEGNISGPNIRSIMTSYWLPGPAAAWQDWGDMRVIYRQALDEYEQNGDESALESTCLSDQCEPYTPQAREKGRTADVLAERAKKETMKKYVVPRGVRYLIASVDVQKGRFDVMVAGIGVDMETWIIDRFRIRDVDPSGRAEDWEEQIAPYVLKRAYPLEGMKDRYMRVKLVVNDANGEDGVTSMAYDFWRYLKKEKLVNRYMLVMGRATGSRLTKSRPEETSWRQKNARAKHALKDMALVWLLNTNLSKDAIDKHLERKEPGAKFVHFATWLPKYVYSELTLEERDDDGKWDKPEGSRQANETLDLFSYIIAGVWALRGNTIKWDKPSTVPSWARPWLNNSLVKTRKELGEDAFIPE